MAVFKCKMCVGAMQITDQAFGQCPFCGTTQTFPKLDDERRAQMYDRANQFRRENEFDKAQGIYEQILSEEPTDAEAYWSIVLCTYGIEYVDDPRTHKKVPTVNRAQFTSIFADKNYLSAIENADIIQKPIYEYEANIIDDIQKGILEVSSKEEPFDIFICYKETDETGQRTKDSVYAQDVYDALIEKGYRVFFSRITLEHKLGSAYEPYIFAALNSSKVMLVIGTNKENYNAVWVKNEWARFLSIIKNDKSKILIPVYRDMSPYELPEEFAYLQAQDMNKIGFMQDLLYGISKIIDKTTIVKETVVVNTTSVDYNNANTLPLLERAFIFLEDGKWQDANNYCEKVLDIDPKNAEAYLGKLMAELHVKTRKQLSDCKQPFDDRDNYAKVIRFGDNNIKTELKGYISYIKVRNEEERLNNIYSNACQAMNKKLFVEAAESFKGIVGFMDSKRKYDECLEFAEIVRKDEIYNSAKLNISAGSTLATINVYKKAIEKLKTIPGWRDADELVVLCEKKIEYIKKAEREAMLLAKKEEEEKRIHKEKATKKRRRIFAIVTPIICFLIVLVIILIYVIIPKQKFNKAMAYLESGDYDSAYALLEDLGDSENILSSKYDRAMEFVESGDYKSALILLEGLDYKDSEKKIVSIKQQFEVEILKDAEVGDKVYFGTYEQDNDTSNGKEIIEWIVLEKEGNRILVISKYALDDCQYNAEYADVTWETCTLRTWLNETFINDAFSEAEQTKISTVTVVTAANSVYGTNPGNDTQDKIFLLSSDEVEQYLDSSYERKCVPTDFAIAQGADKSDGDTCWWWLRSPGSYQYNAAVVDHNGNVGSIGGNVYYTYAIRPALWINLE